MTFIIVGLSILSCVLCILLLVLINKNKEIVIGDLIVAEDPVDGRQMLLALYEDNLDYILKQQTVKIRVKHKKP